MRLRVRALRAAAGLRPAARASRSAVRRRLLAALADLGDVREACRVAGVSRGRLLAMLAEDPAFQASWESLSGARLLLLDWALADRAMAALHRPAAEPGDALPDKGALALAQWLVGERGRPRGRGAAATPAPAAQPMPRRAARTAEAGAGAEADDSAEIAELIETVRARIEAAEAELRSEPGDTP
ncbi:MAG: hypothetical protein ACK4Z0_03945 [Sphingomonadaceae bacterium]